MMKLKSETELNMRDLSPLAYKFYSESCPQEVIKNPISGLYSGHGILEFEELTFAEMQEAFEDMQAELDRFEEE